jgi:predicted CXXCH cytochrome family protein
MIIETCGACHGGVIESYKDSFHGKAVALGAKDSPDCTGCHGAHKVLSKKDPLSLTHPDQKTQLCAECHGNGAIGVNAQEHYELEPTGYSAPMYWINKAFMWLILLVVGFFLIHIILDLLHRLRTRKQ